LTPLALAFIRRLYLSGVNRMTFSDLQALARLDA
jgi:hypothetical protein